MAPSGGGQATTGSSFAALLRRHREAAALSQEALAERAGLSVRAVSDLERGVKTRPHLETVRLLAEALGLDAAAQAELARAARPTAGPAPAAANTGRSGAGELPFPTTPLVDREQAIANITALVSGGECRVVTLIGPGGVGKTRLAIAACRALLTSFAQVGWVELAPLTDPSLVLPAIARGLGVGEAGNASLLTAVRENLRSRRVLLVLDNCEHLLAALQPLVGELIAACPELTVLATSRAPLRLQGEHLFPVVPLALPSLDRPVAIEALGRNPAVTLFAQRASAVRPDFTLTAQNAEDVVAICARVDGLPLAIELVAVRTRTIPPSVLVASLNERLRLLTGGPADMPARHQTLRETLAWSHDLLSEPGRWTFRQLAVFAGGCTLAAATEVIFAGDVFAAMDGLTELVDHSLLDLEEGPAGEPRYRMLETVREFAAEHLAASGARETLRAAHAAYFVIRAEEASEVLSGSDEAALLDRLAADHDNFRAAFGWALGEQASEGDADLALRLAVALWPFWHMRGYIHEGHHWLEQAVGRRSRVAPDTRAAAYLTLANLAINLCDLDEASAMYQASLNLYHETRNAQGAASASIGLGLIATLRGDYPLARDLLQQSLAVKRRADDLLAPVRSLYALGCLAIAEGEYDGAERVFNEAARLCRQHGADVWLAYLSLERSRMARYQGRSDEGARWAAECLPRFREIGERRAEAATIMELGFLTRARGETAHAVELLCRAGSSLAELHDELGLTRCLEGLMGAALDARQFELAARLGGATAAWRSATQMARTVAEQAAAEDQLLAARRSLGDSAFSLCWQSGEAMTLRQALVTADGLPGFGGGTEDRLNTDADKSSTHSSAAGPRP